MRHVPVLLDTVVRMIDPKPDMFLIDGTLDGGGHAEACIERMLPRGTFLGVDLDKGLLMRTSERLETMIGPHKGTFRTIWKHGSYTDIPSFLEDDDLGKADVLLLDLGFSSEQLDASERGFSFQRNEPLDMRYDTERNDLTAAICVNQYDEKDLEHIFREYGEERFARRIAAHIALARKKQPILYADELARTIEEVLPRRGKIHPATRVFQALRIHVNGELDSVSSILASLDRVVRPGGKVIIISFHSLEDRLVKQAFRERARAGRATLITKKAVQAEDAERRENPRSRSAKLRVIQIL